MRDSISPDSSSAGGYLAHALTDLMTSLMVIFVLLLLVFLNHTAGLNAAKTDALLSLLQRELPKDGFRADQIALDSKDRFAVVVTVPNELMNFELNSFTLRPEGEQFLDTRFPRFAGLLCSSEFRNSIDSVVVEGHSDATPYRGLMLEESRNRNLKLSQDRSMEVVKRALQALGPSESDRACFLEKLSAAGRGEQDLEATADRSRRVIFKIRVKAESAGELSGRVVNALGSDR